MSLPEASCTGVTCVRLFSSSRHCSEHSNTWLAWHFTIWGRNSTNYLVFIKKSCPPPPPPPPRSLFFKFNHVKYIFYIFVPLTLSLSTLPQFQRERERKKGGGGGQGGRQKKRMSMYNTCLFVCMSVCECA